MLRTVAVVMVAGALCGASAFARNETGPVITPVAEVAAPKAAASAPKVAAAKPAQPSREVIAERDALEDNASVSLGIGPFMRPNLGLVFTR
jgi:hypothetical protein